MDCHFWESENTVHILDFKTGNSSPDKRQAYVYLLAAQSLFPDHSAIASFYNLETQEWSEPIEASPEYLECVLIELVLLSKKWGSNIKRDRMGCILKPKESPSD